MMRALPFVVLVPGLLSACAGTQSVQSAPVSSFSSASAYSAPSYQPLQTTAAVAAPGELMVRPDRVLQVFAVRTPEGVTKGRLDALKAAVSELERRLKEATGGDVDVVVTGVRLEQRGRKVADGGLVAVLDGEIVLAFSEDSSPWDRGHRLFGVQEVAAMAAEEGMSAPGLDKDQKLELSFGVPSPQVANPERYREQLTRAWTERVKAFAGAAQTPRAPLTVVDCQPPAAVSQRPISIERVGLSLQPTCRIDVALPHAAAGPTAAAQ